MSNAALRPTRRLPVKTARTARTPGSGKGSLLQVGLAWEFIEELSPSRVMEVRRDKGQSIGTEFGPKFGHSMGRRPTVMHVRSIERGSKPLIRLGPPAIPCGRVAAAATRACATGRCCHSPNRRYIFECIRKGLNWWIRSAVSCSTASSRAVGPDGCRRSAILPASSTSVERRSGWR